MIKVFLDSDVVISSLVSKLGASHQLINNKDVVCFISDVSYKELLKVIKKLGLDEKNSTILIKSNLKIIKLKKSSSDFKNYVNDVDDAHIVAGTVELKTNFLITYNTKDFIINKIKEKFNIQIMTPGLFLQFLRSKK